jgi:AraC family transcriptional regulator
MQAYTTTYGTEPRIETLPEKKLVGKRLTMSLSNNKTFELWKSFMPERNLIKNSRSTDLLCIQVYDPSHDFKNFNPDTVFEKWAAQEVSDFTDVPETMVPYTLRGGLYAVFLHRGASATFYKTFQYIFGAWLPQSEYDLDTREHFELLGDKYKNDDPDSEEEIWVPIKLKE